MPPGFLETARRGFNWPLPTESVRLKGYRWAQDLYDGNLATALGDASKQPVNADDSGQPINSDVRPWPETLTEYWIDTLLAVEPRVLVGGKRIHPPILEDMDRAVRHCLLLGDVVGQVTDGSSDGMGLVHPSRWVPVVDGVSGRRRGHFLVNRYGTSGGAGDPVNVDRASLFWTIRDRESGRWSISEWDAGATVASVAEVERLAVPDRAQEWPPVVVASWASVDGVIGASMFANTGDMLAGLLRRTTGVRLVLDQHTRPGMAGDAELVTTKTDADGNETREVDAVGAFMPVNEGGVMPRYLTWDSNLTADFEWTRRTVLEMLAKVGVSPYLLGVERPAGGYALSGAALRRFMLRQLYRARRVRAVLRPWLRDLTASWLAAGGRSGVEVVVQWPDYLEIEDAVEQANLLGEDDVAGRVRQEMVKAAPLVAEVGNDG